MNKAILTGNVGQTPDSKTTNSGTKIVNFSLATNEFKKNNGDKKQETSWHRIVCFDKLAEIIEQYVDKGDKLAIEGKINPRSYEDKEGNKKYITEIVAYSIEMLGSNNNKNEKESNENENNENNEEEDDDLPF